MKRLFSVFDAKLRMTIDNIISTSDRSRCLLLSENNADNKDARVKHKARHY